MLQKEQEVKISWFAAISTSGFINLLDDGHKGYKRWFACFVAKKRSNIDYSWSSASIKERLWSLLLLMFASCTCSVERIYRVAPKAKNHPSNDTTLTVACHADILRGSSRAPAPKTSADFSGKIVEQSQQTSRSGKCTLDPETCRAWLSSRKDQKGLMKGEDFTVLEQTAQLTHKRSY